MSYPEERAQLLDSLEQHKAALREAADEVKDATQSWASVREWVRNRPAEVLFTGAVIGWLLGSRR